MALAQLVAEQDETVADVGQQVLCLPPRRAGVEPARGARPHGELPREGGGARVLARVQQAVEVEAVELLEVGRELVSAVVEQRGQPR